MRVSARESEHALGLTTGWGVSFEEDGAELGSREEVV
jgi:hypothetical protein